MLLLIFSHFIQPGQFVNELVVPFTNYLVAELPVTLSIERDGWFFFVFFEYLVPDIRNGSLGLVPNFIIEVWD